MRTSAKSTLLLIAGMALSLGAQAHGGGDTSAHSEIAFLQGLLHPLSGLDHLAAMLAVGFWSATSARRVWVAPMAFANMLLVGALLGMSGYSLPAVEPLIAASLLVLGLLVAARKQLPAAAATALVGGFAVFHGVAHGAELGGTSSWMAPLLGMLLGTAALHLTGLLSGLALRERSAWWSRAAGGVVALLGTTLLAQMA